MGSNLSIVNDTPDVWYCKIGPDEAALEIVNYIGVAIGLLGALATGGASLALSGSALVGVTASTAITLAGSIATAATYAGALTAISGTIAYEIAKANGMERIEPGGYKHTWGGLTLSLWQQGTCMKAAQNNADMTVTVHTLYMRPIFSGATDNSNLDHSIQWWLDKWGTATNTLYVQNMEGRSWSEVDVYSDLIGSGTTSPPPPPSLGPPGSLGEWEVCQGSSECQNSCCSGLYSDNILKCTPVGGYKPTEGCVAPGPAETKLEEWLVCSDSNQCENQCCSGKYSGGELKCTPVGGFQPSEGCVGSGRRHLLRSNSRKSVVFGKDFHAELLEDLVEDKGLN